MTRESPPAEATKSDISRYDAAQELCFQAWKCAGQKKGEDAIWEALELSRYCTDGFNYLAELFARNLEERLLLFNRGMIIGESYFGSKFFKEETGRFYGLVDTRPYMRSRWGVAHGLRNLACRMEASSHFEALLALDEDDHLGARLVLTTLYLELRQFEKMRALYHRYVIEGPHGNYNKVLFLDLSGASNERYDMALTKALFYNRFVPLALTEKHFSSEKGQFGVNWMGPDGAEEYRDISLQLWKANPEALQRLSRRSKQLLREISKKTEEIRRLIADDDAKEQRTRAERRGQNAGKSTTCNSEGPGG